RGAKRPIRVNRPSENSPVQRAGVKFSIGADLHIGEASAGGAGERRGRELNRRIHLRDRRAGGETHRVRHHAAAGGVLHARGDDEGVLRVGGQRGGGGEDDRVAAAGSVHDG